MCRYPAGCHFPGHPWPIPIAPSSFCTPFQRRLIYTSVVCHLLDGRGHVGATSLPPSSRRRLARNVVLTTVDAFGNPLDPEYKRIGASRRTGSTAQREGARGRLGARGGVRIARVGGLTHLSTAHDAVPLPGFWLDYALYLLVLTLLCVMLLPLWGPAPASIDQLKNLRCTHAGTHIMRRPSHLFQATLSHIVIISFNMVKSRYNLVVRLQLGSSVPAECLCIPDMLSSRAARANVGLEFVRCANRAQERSLSRRDQSLVALSGADGRHVSFSKEARKRIPDEVLDLIRWGGGDELGGLQAMPTGRIGGGTHSGGIHSSGARSIVNLKSPPLPRAEITATDDAGLSWQGAETPPQASPSHHHRVPFCSECHPLLGPTCVCRA